MSVTVVKATQNTEISPRDIEEISALPQQIMDAWREGSGEAFADAFSQEGTMILPGHCVFTSKEIEKFMGYAFGGPYKGSQVVGSPVRLTVLSSTSVAMLTEGGVIPAGADELPEDARVFATWTVVKTGSGWKLASYQNTTQQAAA